MLKSCRPTVTMFKQRLSHRSTSGTSSPNLSPQARDNETKVPRNPHNVHDSGLTRISSFEDNGKLFLARRSSLTSAPHHDADDSEEVTEESVATPVARGKFGPAPPASSPYVPQIVKDDDNGNTAAACASATTYDVPLPTQTLSTEKAGQLPLSSKYVPAILSDNATPSRLPTTKPILAQEEKYVPAFQHMSPAAVGNSAYIPQILQ